MLQNRTHTNKKKLCVSYPGNESPDISDNIDIVSVNTQDIADRPYVSSKVLWHKQEREISTGDKKKNRCQDKHTCCSISSVALSFSLCSSKHKSRSRIFSPWASTWSVNTLTCRGQSPLHSNLLLTKHFCFCWSSNIIQALLIGYLKDQRLFVTLKPGKSFLVVVTPTQRDVPIGLGKKKITYFTI